MNEPDALLIGDDAHIVEGDRAVVVDLNRAEPRPPVGVGRGRPRRGPVRPAGRTRIVSRKRRPHPAHPCITGGHPEGLHVHRVVVHDVDVIPPVCPVQEVGRQAGRKARGPRGVVGRDLAGGRVPGDFRRRDEDGSVGPGIRVG